MSIELVVTIDIQNWNHRETDEQIVSYVEKELGYERVGSGAGFGERNLEFEVPKKLTKKELKNISNVLTEKLGFSTIASVYEY